MEEFNRHGGGQHTHRRFHAAGGQHIGPRHLHALGLNARGLLDSVVDSNVATRLLARADCDGADKDSNICEKPAAGTSLTVPITCVVVFVVGGLICVLIYFHRKTVKRHRMEDADEKYQSLDFGFDERGKSDSKGGKSGNQRKSGFFGSAEKDTGPGHKAQLSMDMNLSSPYLLPPDIQGSRDSISSLAKTLHEDPYRSVGQYTGSDVGSIRSFSRGPDGASVHTPKSNISGDQSSGSASLPSRQRSLPPSSLPLPPQPAQEPRDRQGLATIPQSASPTKMEFRSDRADLPPVPADTSAAGGDHADMPEMPQPIQEPAPVALRGPSPSPHPADHMIRGQSYSAEKKRDSHRDSGVLPQPGPGRGLAGAVPSMDTTLPPARSSPPTQPLPATPQKGVSRTISDASSAPSVYEGNDSAIQLDTDPWNNDTKEDRGSQRVLVDHEVPPAPLGVPAHANNRLSIGLRPLPPDDFLESDDPEFRANRIRSFYKEYFDDTNPNQRRPPPPSMPPLSQHPALKKTQYYEDYDADYMADGAFYDPDTNAFVMPYAEPVTRRAMTPPPRNRMPKPGPRGPIRGPHGSMGGMSSPGGPRPGTSFSGARVGPRPGSSVSSRMTPGKARKPMPPPAALNTLPTPSKLKDDSFALMGSIDFAPPPSFKDHAAGRSQSPIGERRPYQITVPAATPLVSAFDDIPALPSAHSLRKSSTFTGLDFAPPRQFHDPETASDTRSVRSVGSGISSRQLGAIRNGAGRVSRLPGDQVFTAAAMADTLKPKWDMGAR